MSPCVSHLPLLPQAQSRINEIKDQGAGVGWQVMLPWLFIRLFIHTRPLPVQQRFKSGLYVFTHINNRCPSEHSRAPACSLPTPGIQANKASRPGQPHTAQTWRVPLGPDPSAGSAGAQLGAL